MPTARESLLDAAFAEIADRPWAAVHMVDVAAAARVSRQTLYNEFGSKEGLARALARREAEAFLAGLDNALAGAERDGGDAGDRCAAATAWILRAARRNPLVRAALTGCRGERLPAAAVAALAAVTGIAPDQGTSGATGLTDRHTRPAPAERAAPPTAELVTRIRDHTAGALEHGYPGLDVTDIGWACEAAVRLALSYVIAPSVSDEEACRQVARLVRGLLAAT
jgi:AcrR family transcriptional regulator